jgi:hypothetical protein
MTYTNQWKGSEDYPEYSSFNLEQFFHILHINNTNLRRREKHFEAMISAHRYKLKI